MVRSFTWGWPTTTHTSLQDLVAAPEFFDPLLSWTPVPGAAKYELDVNFSQDFNTSSRVYSATTVATGFSPVKPFPNNTYYWRVRPINAQGDDGVWTQGSSFTQFFDTVAAAARGLDGDGGAHARRAQRHRAEAARLADSGAASRLESGRRGSRLRPQRLQR